MDLSQENKTKLYACDAEKDKLEDEIDNCFIGTTEAAVDCDCHSKIEEMKQTFRRNCTKFTSDTGRWVVFQ